MSAQILPSMAPSAKLSQLPVKIDQSTSTGSSVARLLLLSPALVAGVAALVALSQVAGDMQSFATLVTERPMASAQVLTAIVLWIALFVAPASVMITRLCKRRDATISSGLVEIVDQFPLGTRKHSVALTEYLGIAHHIRASLSGLTHELVLVHANPSLNINLMVREKVTQADLECAKALLGLPEVPARALYTRQAATRLADRAQLSAAVPASA